MTRRLARRLAVAVLSLVGAAAAADPLPPPALAADSAAVTTHQVPPAYPKGPLQKGIDGCVLLSFTIDAEGRGQDFKVLESKPKGVFDAATLKVMDQWRFAQPARQGRYAQLVQYRLEGRKPVNVCQPLPSFAALNPDAPPLTRKVRVLETVMPDFKRAAPGVDGGCVTVRFQIKHDGFVGDVTVLQAKPEELGPAAVAALKQWHFESFPPPDIVATQTFNYTPELVRLPDTVIRSAYLEAADGGLRSVGCGGNPAPGAATNTSGAKQ